LPRGFGFIRLARPLADRRISISSPPRPLALLLAAALLLASPAGVSSQAQASADWDSTLFLLPIVDGQPSAGRVWTIHQSLGRGGAYLKVGFSAVFRYMADVDPSNDFAIVPTRLVEIVETARQTGAPFLVHLNGGRWAGGGPLLEKLAADPAAMTRDQQGRPWPHQVDGEYYFSLAQANTAYRQYKQRNLEAAAAWLADFAAGPDGSLLVGVSTDSEVIIHHLPYADYNPLAIAEFRQWLSAEGPYGPDGRWARDGQGLSLAQANARYAKRLRRWSDLDPPGENDGSRLWQDWTTFRTLLVDHSVQEQVDWIAEAGLPGRMIFSHQSPALKPDVFGDALSTAAVEGGNLGITLYGEQTRDQALLDTVRTLSPVWGVFEYSTGPLDPDTLFTSLDLLRSRAPRIVCPYHWDDLGGPNEAGYTIMGTPLETALRRLVTVYADQPLPGTAP
jgi:hypothetical protein